jgi:hypothetical protein
MTTTRDGDEMATFWVLMAIGVACILMSVL